MQDPPRGGYYPASAASQQARQFQYNATNPWQREEKEKEQAMRREAAKLWRDQQIAELSCLTHRTPQQEEQLRALQLERDFQKRAEEAANQQDDDDESNDIDNESLQRVQGLLRMAANQDRTNQLNQQNTLSRTNMNNQSIRGGMVPSQAVASQLQSSSVTLHTATSQQGLQRSGNIYMGQSDNSGSHSQQMPSLSNIDQQSAMSPTYGSSIIGQLTNSVKSNINQIQQSNDDQEQQQQQRRMDEYKRKQMEYDESQTKNEDEMRQQQFHQQQMHQLYQQHQQNQPNIKNQMQQQQLHPGMLRLDNLIINGPESPATSQNGGNDAPPPPERGSSYAIMSQQNVLRSNISTASNIPVGSLQSSSIKRVSFHDPNANVEQIPRSNTSINPSTPSSITMDTIREDPNVSYLFILLLIFFISITFEKIVIFTHTLSYTLNKLININNSRNILSKFNILLYMKLKILIINIFY